jgi:hypothetical protein
MSCNKVPINELQFLKSGLLNHILVVLFKLDVSYCNGSRPLIFISINRVCRWLNNGTTSCLMPYPRMISQISSKFNGSVERQSIVVSADVNAVLSSTINPLYYENSIPRPWQDW